jgi:hypothetical protein
MDGYWTLDRYPDHFGPVERDRLKEVLREAPKGKDVVLFEGTSLTWHPAPDSLDAAWAEAKAALPEGGRLSLRLYDKDSYEVSVYWEDKGPVAYSELGSNEMAALRAMAAYLRGLA